MIFFISKNVLPGPVFDEEMYQLLVTGSCCSGKAGQSGQIINLIYLDVPKV